MPYWVSKLDKSKSICIKTFTLPVFVFWPCKPHIEGNEYHTIGSGESVSMHVWEIVKGMDHPIPMGGDKFEVLVCE